MATTSPERTVQRDGTSYAVGRRVGGFAWPGEQPGFLVVLAEELIPEVGPPFCWHYHVIATFEETDNDRLIRQALDLSRVHGFSDWYGREDVDYQDYWNRRVRQHGLAPFYVRWAPGVERPDAGHTISLVRSLTAPGQKRLWGLGHTQLAGYLGQIGGDKPPPYGQVPALDALGAAVGQLENSDNADEEYTTPFSSVGTGRNAVTGY